MSDKREKEWFFLRLFFFCFECRKTTTIKWNILMNDIKEEIEWNAGQMTGIVKTVNGNIFFYFWF